MSITESPRQRRFPLGVSKEELIRQEVEDARAASPAERMAVAVALLDAAYDLWRTRGIAGDQPRSTADNARRARKAVDRWGGFEPDFSAEEFISGDILSFGGLLRVEVNSRVPGATRESVWRRRVPGELLGVPADFAGLDDLIAMKEAIGRKDKDVPDLARLRRLRDISEGG